MEMQPINSYHPDTVDRDNSSLVWSASPEWLNEMGIKDLGKPQTDDNPDTDEIDPVCGGIIGLTVFGLTNYFINRAEKKRKRQPQNTVTGWGLGGHPQPKTMLENMHEVAVNITMDEFIRTSREPKGPKFDQVVQENYNQLHREYEARPPVDDFELDQRDHESLFNHFAKDNGSANRKAVAHKPASREVIDREFE